jgi:CRP/FNR family cyclic AMP-dependent transcriptional regulator
VQWTILEGVPDSDRDRFLAIGRPCRYSRGDVVFLAGASPDALHLVETGKLAVRAGTETGEMALLSVLGPGDFFGELALLEPEAGGRTATVTALEPSDVIAVSREKFSRLRAEHPSVDRVLVRVLAAQVRRTSSLLVDAMYLPAEPRIFRRLLDVARVWGGAEPGMVLPLTQEDIAGLAGTTRPTANRALRQAEVAGLVAIGRGRIELLDPTGIATLAGAD